MVEKSMSFTGVITDLQVWRFTGLPRRSDSRHFTSIGVADEGLTVLRVLDLPLEEARFEVPEDQRCTNFSHEFLNLRCFEGFGGFGFRFTCWVVGKNDKHISQVVVKHGHLPW